MSRIFHLYIDEVGPSKFSVTVGDRTRAQEEVIFSEDAEFQEQLNALNDRSPGRLQIDLPAYDDLCSDIGDKLFQYFIAAAPTAHLEFREASAMGGPRLALHLPPSLFKLPWEILHDPLNAKNIFIATRQNGSVFRCDGADGNAQTRDYPALQPPLDLIFVLSNPTERFFGIVTPPKSNGNINFLTVEPPSFEAYRSFISRVNASELGFIFVGHGDIINNIGHIVFVDPVRENVFFSRYAENPRPGWSIVDGCDKRLRLGFFCACESAWARGGTQFYNSVVGATLKRSDSIAYVVGAQTPIEARAAQIMLGTTLSYLTHRPLDLALSEARSQIRAMPPTKKQPFTAFDWWIPVLYTKTTNLQILEHEEKSSVIESAIRSVPMSGSSADVPLEFSGIAKAIARSVGALLRSENDRDLFG